MGQNCHSAGFITWFVLLAYPAHTIGIGVASWTLMFSAKKKSNKVKIIISGIYLLTLIISLMVIWFYPQKRITNLLLSFLHGPIYDRRIELDWGIILSRSAHLIFGLFLLVSRRTIPKKHYFYPAILALTVIIVRTASINWPSQQHGHSKLQHLMPQKISGNGFELYYKKSKKKEHNTRIDNFVKSIEFHLNELSFLKGQINPVITIYIYPNKKSKKLWFGGGGTDITDVFSPSIHTTLSGLNHPTLRHELVHALTSSYAFHGLGFHPNMAFTEGIAVALAPWAKEQTLNEATAQLVNLKRMPELKNLLSPLFWGQSSSRSYTVAGSLISFLIRDYGIEKVKALYAGASFYEAFKQEQQTIIDRWQLEIDRTAKNLENNLSSEKISRSKGVLKDQCPHSKSDYANTSPHLLSKIRQPYGWSPKRDYYQWLASIDNSNLEAKLEMWKADIKNIASGAFSLVGRMRPWFRLIEEHKKWPPKNIEQVELIILEADMLRVSGQQKQSYKVLRDLKNLADKTELGSKLTREIYARIYLEEDLPIEEAEEWRRYLAGWLPRLPELAITNKDKQTSPWITTYLATRNTKFRKQINKQTILSIIKTTPPKAMPTSFYTEWYRILGSELAKHLEYQKASEAYNMSGSYAESGSKSYYKMLVRKMKYFAETQEKI